MDKTKDDDDTLMIKEYDYFFRHEFMPSFFYVEMIIEGVEHRNSMVKRVPHHLRERYVKEIKDMLSDVIKESNIWTIKINHAIRNLEKFNDINALALLSQIDLYEIELEKINQRIKQKKLLYK